MGRFSPILALVAVLALSGCATSRSVVTVAPAAAPANPADGVPVKVEKVEDLRVFESAPSQPDIPSLSDGDIANPATKARAIGRKRNSYGKALGDVLLPEGQTVAELVRTSLISSLRESGYRVLSPSDPGYAQAAPLQIRIRKFWSWFQPGFWSIQTHNRSEVELTGGPALLKDGLVIEASVSESMQVVLEWMRR